MTADLALFLLITRQAILSYKMLEEAKKNLTVFLQCKREYLKIIHPTDHKVPIT